MPKQTNIVEQFTHLITQGQQLSHDKIAAHSVEMMHKIATCPTQRLTWQSLKMALEAIYESLDEGDQHFDNHAFNSHIAEKLQRLTR